MKALLTQISLTAISSALLFTMSCADDQVALPVDLSDSEIHFTARVLNQSDIVSRDNNRKLYYQFTAEKLPYADDMYLLTEVEDRINSNPFGDDSAIAYVDQMTRASLINGTSDFVADHSNEKINICSFVYGKDYDSYDAAIDADDSLIEQYIGDLGLTISNGSSSGTYKTTPDKTHYWPQRTDVKMQFYGLYPSPADYEPASEDSFFVTPFDSNHEEHPTFTTSVDLDTKTQKDYMVGEVSTALFSTSVSLQMKHVMTAVTVSLGSKYAENYEVTSVEFEHIGVRGTYDMIDKTWTLDPYYKHQTVVAEFPIGTSVSSMKSAGTYFIMMPQEFEEDAKLSVIIRPKNATTTEGEKEIEASLSSGTLKAWTANTKVNYVINDTAEDVDWYIEPEQEEIEYSYDGTPVGHGEAYLFKVYKYDADGNVEKDSSGNDVTVDAKISDYGKLRALSYKVVSGADSEEWEAVPFTVEEVADDSGTLQKLFLKANQSDQIASTDYNFIDITQYNNSDSKYDDIKDNITGVNFETTVFMKESEETIEPNTSEDSQNLKKNEEVTLGSAESPIDLSVYKPDGVTKWDSSGNRYGSNCYIINYPGYYMIPIVYGCSLNAGDTDTSTFQFSTSSESGYTTVTSYNGTHNLLTPLTNWTDADIYYTAWLQYNASSDKTAYPGADGGTSFKDISVTWQDAKNLIKIDNDHLSNKIEKNGWFDYYKDKYYLYFHVGVDGCTFAPGNAVIQVINTKSLPIWSYHIWVTPYTYNDTFECTTNVQGSIGTAKFLKVPLGFVKNDYYVHKERKTKVRLVQLESEKRSTKTVTLLQKKHEFRPVSCVYYQWGRKDPFPGTQMEETGHMNYLGFYEVTTKYKPVYTEDNVEISGSSTSGEKIPFYIASASDNPTIGYGICYPNTFFTGYRFPYQDVNRNDRNYWNLWGCTVNKEADTAKYDYPYSDQGSSSVKTVYDPSPIGFKVPPIYGFPAINYKGLDLTAVFSPYVNAYNTEEEVYNNSMTTYTDHTQFVDNVGFEFYSKMNGGVKDKDSDTYFLYALGRIDRLTGNYQYVGKVGYYYSGTRWASGDGATNQRKYHVEVGYDGSGSLFNASVGECDFYAMPVLPMVVQ